MCSCQPRRIDKKGPDRELNPGPHTSELPRSRVKPEARIILLDHQATIIVSTRFRHQVPCPVNLPVAFIHPISQYQDEHYDSALRTASGIASEMDVDARKDHQSRLPVLRSQWRVSRTIRRSLIPAVPLVA
jgi:hypothetical protein